MLINYTQAQSRAEARVAELRAKADAEVEAASNRSTKCNDLSEMIFLKMIFLKMIFLK